MTNATNESTLVTPLSDWDIPIRDIPQAETVIEYKATPEQLGAIEKALDLASCASLTLSVTVKSGAPGGVACTGRLSAALEQNCIVTLEPVPATVDEDVNALFVQTIPGSDNSQSEEEDLNILENLSLEPFDGTTLELGRLAFEVLASSLDPYPKAPGAHLGEITAPKSATQDPGANSPFAKLKKLEISKSPDKPE